MDNFEDEIRTSLARPIPTLSIDFEQRLESEIARRSAPLGTYGRRVLLAYGLASTFASAVVMRGQGLAWSIIVLAILVPLVILATTTLVRRSAEKT